jgi:Mg-chelatase subunit ChlD
MPEKKGVELTKTDSSPGISITIGNTAINSQGHPISVRFEKEMAYVYLVIDTSGSMANDKLEQAKRGILDFAKDAFRKEYMVGLISFNTTATHVCDPTYDMEILKECVRGMNATGSTNMEDAIKMAHDHIKKLKNTRVIVIATDGLPDNKQTALKEAAKAKEDKIDIITIGTDDANQEFLKKLASRSGLSKKVERAMFSQAISSASKLLPSPKSITKR